MGSDKRERGREREREGDREGERGESERERESERDLFLYTDVQNFAKMSVISGNSVK